MMARVKKPQFPFTTASISLAYSNNWEFLVETHRDYPNKHSCTYINVHGRKRWASLDECTHTPEVKGDTMYCFCFDALILQLLLFFFFTAYCVLSAPRNKRLWVIFITRAQYIVQFAETCPFTVLTGLNHFAHKMH